MKVGEYVRTKDGRIFKWNNLCTTDKKDYEEHTRKILFIEDEIKSSSNIIDLIEVGDYVNGQEVRYIDKGNGYCYLAIDEDYTYLIAGYDKDGLTMPIKSVVTKEQFSQMEYRIGE